MFSVCYECKGAHEIERVTQLGHKYCKSCWHSICFLMDFIEDKKNLQMVCNVVRAFYKSQDVDVPILTIT